MSFAAVPGPPAPPGPGRPPRFSRWQRGAAAGGLAVGLALGGAGISFAASSSTPSTTNPPNAPGKHGPDLPGFRHGLKGLGGFGGFGGPGRMLHGQFTVQTPSGAYQTVLVQVGKASAVTPTSITVTSTDGYSHTYVVSPSTNVDAQRDGISSISGQDQVRVVAVHSASKDSAASIVDMTQLRKSKGGFGFGPARAPGSLRGTGAFGVD